MADGRPAALMQAAASADLAAFGTVQPATARSLKILHILRAPLGGLFRHVLDIARGQIARGHRVGLIVDSTTGGARADADTRARSCHSSRSGSSASPLRASWTRRDFKRVGLRFRGGSGAPRPTYCTAMAPKAPLWRG